MASGSRSRAAGPGGGRGTWAEGVGQPAWGGGAEQRGAAQAAQVDPRPPAGGRTCYRTWGRGVRGLRTHGHLRLWTGGRGAPWRTRLRGWHLSPSGPVLDATEPITPG